MKKEIEQSGDAFDQLAKSMSIFQGAVASADSGWRVSDIAQTIPPCEGECEHLSCEIQREDA